MRRCERGFIEPTVDRRVGGAAGCRPERSMLGVCTGPGAHGSATSYAFANGHLRCHCYFCATYPSAYLHGDPYPYRYKHSNSISGDAPAWSHGHSSCGNATATLYAAAYPNAHRDIPPGHPDAERQVRWR